MIFAAIGDVAGIIQSELQGWLDGLIHLLPNIIVAIILAVLLAVIARYFKRYSLRLLNRFTGQKEINKLLSSLMTGVLILLGAFLILGILNLDKTVTSLLAGAGIVGLALGLAFQEPIINTISGVLMSVRELYNLGDLVETNGYLGKIREIHLRSTTLQKLSGELVTIPNKLIIQNPLKNLTISGERRIELNCGISYGEDLKHVREIALQAIESEIDYRMKNKPVEFYYTGYGDSSIDFVIRFWIDLCEQKDYFEARSRGVIAIKSAFDQNGITIPFPIRTLDFGIKGGKMLSEDLSELKNFEK
jgi:small conductance mechanosensitive channel